jgi:hypothetical protein
VKLFVNELDKLPSPTASREAGGKLLRGGHVSVLFIQTKLVQFIFGIIDMIVFDNGYNTSIQDIRFSLRVYLYLTVFALPPRIFLVLDIYYMDS